MSLRFRSNFPTFKKKVLLFRAVFILIALNFFIIESVIARHKCPKVPAPPGVMGIISSTTLIPSGSTMAAARSSETSGCERGHPSKNFYKPKNRRLSIFLKDNLNYVSQESSQGKGFHLEALVSLAGCKFKEGDFGKIMKKNYAKIFFSNQLVGIEKSPKSSVDQISERLIDLMTNVVSVLN